MRITLHKYLSITYSIFAICAVGIAVAYLHTASRYRESTELLVAATMNIDDAQSITINLSTHRRQSLLKRVQSEKERTENTVVAEKNILADMNKILQSIDTDQERKLAENVQNAISNYLVNYKSLRGKGVRRENLYEAVAETYFEAADAIQNLVAYYMSIARKAEIESKEQYLVSRDIAQIIGICILSALLIILLSFKSLVYSPLKKLQKEINKFDFAPKQLGLISKITDIQSIYDSFYFLSEKLTKQRDQQLTFLAAVAHDLRNPISAIKMSLEHLVESTDNTRSENKTVIEIIQRQVNYLNNMIEDLLDTTRIESNHLDFKFKKTDVIQLVKESVDLFSSSTRNHRISIQAPHMPLNVICDPLRISQVLNNLLSNAIKYSPHGGNVLITVDNKNSNPSISVTDEGIGISTTDFDSIFEPFRRTKFSKDSIPGIGLGLSTARKIMRAHGGDILVKSTADHGSTFTIMFAENILESQTNALS